MQVHYRDKYAAILYRQKGTTFHGAEHLTAKREGFKRTFGHIRTRAERRSDFQDAQRVTRPDWQR
jgi:hypothetical protein